MNKKIAIWSIAVGLGGLLFGMGVAVRSGAEKAIQTLYNLSDWAQGTAIAMTLYGTAFGAAFCNIPANKIGRKKTIDLIRDYFFNFIYLCSIGAGCIFIYVLSFFKRVKHWCLISSGTCIYFRICTCKIPWPFGHLISVKYSVWHPHRLFILTLDAGGCSHSIFIFFIVHAFSFGNTEVAIAV